MGSKISSLNFVLVLYFGLEKLYLTALGVPIHFLARNTENTTLGQNTILLAKIQPSNKIQREDIYSS